MKNLKKIIMTVVVAMVVTLNATMMFDNDSKVVNINNISASAQSVDPPVVRP